MSDNPSSQMKVTISYHSPSKSPRTRVHLLMHLQTKKESTVIGTSLYLRRLRRSCFLHWRKHVHQVKVTSCEQRNTRILNPPRSIVPSSPPPTKSACLKSRRSSAACRHSRSCAHFDKVAPKSWPLVTFCMEVPMRSGQGVDLSS